MCGCLSCVPHQRTWPTTQACALTGNQTGDPLLHSLVLNPLSHTSQGMKFFKYGQLLANFLLNYLREHPDNSKVIIKVSVYMNNIGKKTKLLVLE